MHFSMVASAVGGVGKVFSFPGVWLWVMRSLFCNNNIIFAQFEGPTKLEVTTSSYEGFIYKYKI